MSDNIVKAAIAVRNRASIFDGIMLKYLQARKPPLAPPMPISTAPTGSMTHKPNENILIPTIFSTNKFASAVNTEVIKENTTI